MTEPKPGRPSGEPDTKAFERIKEIPHRIVVFSGKGGVGKTTVSVNLAASLAARGRRVGLLDADITGPNVVQMMGISEPARVEDGGVRPHRAHGIEVISLASMVPAGVAIVWRGPLRSKAIEQLLTDTAWGDLEILIADLPPGTGDEVLTIAQKISPQLALVVTTPQEVALIDARRAVDFARKLEIPRIALVENMSGLLCPHCDRRIELFGSGTVAREAAALDVVGLGPLPIDPRVPGASDDGVPIVLRDDATAARQPLETLADRVEGLIA